MYSPPWASTPWILSAASTISALRLPPGSAITLPGGKSFTIRAKGLSDSALYIKSATLNGKPLEGNTFTHSQLLEGGVLELEMTEPHK